MILGGRRLLKEKPPRAILIEYSPGVSERAFKWDEMPAYAQSLRAVYDGGYRMWHLEGPNKNRKFKEDWDQITLPPLRYVSRGNLEVQPLPRFPPIPPPPPPRHPHPHPHPYPPSLSPLPKPDTHSRPPHPPLPPPPTPRRPPTSHPS